jgi:hypothetical protein
MKHMKKLYKRTVLIVVAFAGLLVGLSAAHVTEATHSWGFYHWMRTNNPIALSVGDNVSSTWDVYLNTAISDWNTSSTPSVVRLSKVSGLTNPKNCRPVAGRIEVCNAKYGNNGWLGVAQIWINGDHIKQAVAKMNDTYFNTAPYNTPAWRRLVMCQEIAHDFGLDHQDENFSNPNLGTCMDYTNNPGGPPSNEHPNAHDFEQLGVIYAHLDAAFTSFTKAIMGEGQDKAEPDFSELKEWGREVRRDSRGRVSRYERDLGKGKKVITHVLWIDSIEGK